jgi:hypothetical protein
VAPEDRLGFPANLWGTLLLLQDHLKIRAVGGHLKTEQVPLCMVVLPDHGTARSIVEKKSIE